MSQKIFIKTFGCQMNEYDSNRIFDLVKKIGFKKTENYESARFSSIISFIIGFLLLSTVSSYVYIGPRVIQAIGKDYDVLNHERDALGFYFSGHPVIAIDGIVKNLRSHTISEVTDDINRVKIVGLLNSYRQIRDRSNKQIAFISFD